MTPPLLDEPDPLTLPEVPFPLLADPTGYQPSTIDLLQDTQGRETWLRIFETHLGGLVPLAARSAGGTPDAWSRAQQFGREFAAVLCDYRRDPCAHGPPSVLRFCAIRQQLLIRHGFEDPYRSIKDAENAAALAVLPEVLRELDALPPSRQLLAALENVFAGNLFDLGCAGTIAMYESGQAEFRAARRRLPPRPWSVDDLDALCRSLAGSLRDPGLTPAFASIHRKAIVFVDNAGGDIVLGMVPLARWFLARGTRVVLTANTLPALNDVTHGELTGLIDQVAEIDPVIREAQAQGALSLVASGNGLPLIDLSRISPELAEACRGADLLIIEGMGRALETNFRVGFTVDTLKLAMIKEPHVAQTVGGRLYEPVCRFEPATGR